MSISDRHGRSELVQTIQNQEEKIKRYESRLHDLVIAYRTILKEKSTLEETVKALSDGVPSRERKDAKDGGSDSGTSSTAADDADVATETARRVETLTQSLASLTEDKQRMEASYQADRRKLMKEQEEAVQQLRQELESTEIVRRELQREITDLRQRLREHRLQTDRTDADHACMLRELQSLLAKERGAREQLEFEVEELHERLEQANRVNKVERAAAAQTASLIVDRSEMEEYQRRIRDLSNEVEQLRGRQTATEGPLEQLRAELVSVKAEHRVQLQRELHRANEAERRLADFTQQHEERVSSLEARLTELSQTLGSYERTREADQTAISKLRDRVTQLDLENSALAKGISSPAAQPQTQRPGICARDKSPESGCSEDSLEAERREGVASGGAESNQIQEQQQQHDDEVVTLVEKISQLKGKLKLANARAERPVDLACVFAIDSTLQDAIQSADADLHRRCREEYEQLKEEFERYKLKAQSVLLKQSVLSSRSAGPGGSGGGMSLMTKEQADRLQQQVARLKERSRELQDELMNEERLNKRSQAALRRALEEAETRHCNELESCQRVAEQRVGQLDEELTRHRNRTIALLAEKDEEISMLRGSLSNAGAAGALSASIAGGPTQATLTAASMNALLRQDLTDSSRHADTAVLPSPLSPVVANCTIIHCKQERARLVVENRQLREANRALEAAEREMALQRRELEEQVASLERSIRLRGGQDTDGVSSAPSLEYLKNVVFRYMTTSEVDSRRSMLRAIATILHFSPRELHQVEQYNTSGWFSSVR